VISEMKSIYGELFLYQPTPTHTPTENFLTQALADLLNRLQRNSADAHLCFVREVLIGEEHSGNEAMLAEILEKIRGNHPIWNTQKSAYVNNEIRFLDLVLECGGVPLMVVENKLAADYTEGQLPAYRMWIDEKSGACGALVLLTRWTSPPENFLSGTDGVYGGVLKSVCQWNTVYKWLKKNYSKTKESQKTEVSHEFRFLANQFSDFLEEELNVNNTLNMSDLALIQLSRKPLNIVRSLINDIKLPQEIQTSFGRVKEDYQWPGKPLMLCWAPWTKSNIDKQWYASWGLVIDSGEIWGIAFEFKQPTVVVRLCADNKERSIPIDKLKNDQRMNGWEIGKGWVQKTISVTELLSRDPDFEGEYRSWINSALEEAAEILSACGNA